MGKLDCGVASPSFKQLLKVKMLAIIKSNRCCFFMLFSKINVVICFDERSIKKTAFATVMLHLA